VLDDESKNCIPGQLPTFGYTAGGYAGSVAYQTGMDLIHDVFGNPLDAGLFKCDPYKPECVCQQQVFGRVAKLTLAMGKVWLKCKKPGLAGKTPFTLPITSSAELAECIHNLGSINSVTADTTGTIADATTQLGEAITNFCGGPFTGPNDPFGGGVCAGLTFPTLGDCLARQAKCRFCKMENDIDGITVDCGLFAGTTALACQ